MGYESARALAWEYTTYPDQISATLRPRLEAGWKVTRQDYDEVRGIARDCRRQLTDQLRDGRFPSHALRAGRGAGVARLDRRPGVQPRLDPVRRAVRDAAVRRAANGLPLAVQLVGAFDAGHGAAGMGEVDRTPTALITGVSRGLGKELARQYAADGWKVIGTERRDLEMTNYPQIRQFASKLEG